MICQWQKQLRWPFSIPRCRCVALFFTFIFSQAYGLAVVSACGFAYGLGELVKRGGPRLKSFGVLVPLVSVSAANVSNLAFTRMSEITEGSPVSDADGNVNPFLFAEDAIAGITHSLCCACVQVVGLSKQAGFLGVAQTSVTRCMMVPASCLLLPPVIIAGFKR